MGLGKTVECLSLLNLKAAEDFASAERERRVAYVAKKGEAAAAAAAKIPLVRDANGAYVSRATLIICPVSLISQCQYITRQSVEKNVSKFPFPDLHSLLFDTSVLTIGIAELRDKSVRPLKILSYHGTRTKNPKESVFSIEHCRIHDQPTRWNAHSSIALLSVVACVTTTSS
jgi:hypothetical protein